MVITRFAPSPTGDLHVGSARTALFGWLWSKNQKGKFILRIEDTDRERSTQAAVDVILEGLQWMGLMWDEGPIYQTERYPRYREIADQLLATGHAYKCYCSKERLEKLREAQIQAKEKARYDGHCRNGVPNADPNAPFVIRFKTPQTGSVVFTDLIRGSIETQNSELDDLIIVRTDGNPTYNFTVVVDDADMQITHVLRGDDHINNTPRQIHILQALEAKIPEYGHMPMLLGPDGKKLSKRSGAASVLEFEQQGILPKALLNYLVRLGWSYGDKEIFSVEEMIELFDVHAINVAPAAMNPDKLLWINQHYLKTEPEALIAHHLKPYIEKLGLDTSKGPSLETVVVAQRERCKTLVEMAEKSAFWYQDTIVMDPALVTKHLTPEATKPLEALLARLKTLEPWNAAAIHDAMNAVMEELGIKLGLLAQPVRIAVTGSNVSPSVDVTLALLGKEKTLQRLQNALVHTMHSTTVDSGSEGP
jgi:glutamyl-tRNA synthetase